MIPSELLSIILLPTLFISDAFGLAVTPLRPQALKPFASRSSASESPIYLNAIPLLGHSRRRRDGGCHEDDYKLSMSESWTWNMNGTGPPIAKVACSFQTPSGAQPWNGRIVALERIATDITGLQCSSSKITIKFKDRSCLDTAQKNWNWVNEVKDRYLAVVIKSPSCGSQRQVFKVESYKIDAGNLTMSLTAEPVDYVKAFPYMQFYLSTSGTDGNSRPPQASSPYSLANSTQTQPNIANTRPPSSASPPPPPPSSFSIQNPSIVFHPPLNSSPFSNSTLSNSTLNNSTSQSCSITKGASDLSIPVAQDFSGEEIFKPNITDLFDVSLVCGTCKTTGSFDISFVASSDASQLVDLKDAVSASMTITPNDLSATFGLDLKINGKVAQGFTKGLTVLDVPLLPNPLAVAGIANIGPTLTVTMDFSLGPVAAAADISLGDISMQIDNCSQATLDFFGVNNSFTGFTPSFSTTNPQLKSASVSATAGFAPNIILGVDATVLGFGVAAGLALAAPKIDAKLVAGVQGAGGCSGVGFSTDLTATLNAFAGVGEIAEVAADDTFEILATSTQIFSTCATVAVPGATGL